MTNLQPKWFISTNFLFHAHETIGWLQLIDLEGAWLGLAEPDFDWVQDAPFDFILELKPKVVTIWYRLLSWKIIGVHHTPSLKSPLESY